MLKQNYQKYVKFNILNSMDSFNNLDAKLFCSFGVILVNFGFQLWHARHITRNLKELNPVNMLAKDYKKPFISENASHSFF